MGPLTPDAKIIAFEEALVASVSQTSEGSKAMQSKQLKVSKARYQRAVVWCEDKVPNFVKELLQKESFSNHKLVSLKDSLLSYGRLTPKQVDYVNSLLIAEPVGDADSIGEGEVVVGPPLKTKTSRFRRKDLLEICTWISGSSTGIVRTTRLFKAFGIGVKGRAPFRAKLYALERLGCLSKRGKGSFLWRVKSGWKVHLDMNNPGSLFVSVAAVDSKHLPDTATIEKLVVALAPPTDAEKLQVANHQITLLEGRLIDTKVKLKNAEGRIVRIDVKRGKIVKKIAVEAEHAVFAKVIQLASAGRNILLVGPAGCGKTYLGHSVAKALGRPFGTLSCTSGMSESHLTGRSVPNITTGKHAFVSTEFLNLYEKTNKKGGIFLLDELDAADPNMMIVIHAAISGGEGARLPLPLRDTAPHAERHHDFVLIATANTFGRGADRMYVGRNQLDEATLDRFRIGTVECGYDPNIEEIVCPDIVLRARLQRIRSRIEQHRLRRVLSTRYIEDAYVMKTEAEWSDDEIVETFLQGWSKEERAKVVA